MVIIRPIVPCPKPEPRRVVKAREAREDAGKRRACLDLVWRRAGNRCENCDRPVKRADDPAWTERNAGHGHEVIYRSRGGDPHEPMNVVLLCDSCHRQAHGIG